MMLRRLREHMRSSEKSVKYADATGCETLRSLKGESGTEKLQELNDLLNRKIAELEELQHTEPTIDRLRLEQLIDNLSEHERRLLWKQIADEVNEDTELFQAYKELGLWDDIRDLTYYSDGNRGSKLPVVWNEVSLDGENVGWYDTSDRKVHMIGAPPTTKDLLLSMCVEGDLPQKLKDLRELMLLEEERELSEYMGYIKLALELAKRFYISRGSLEMYATLSVLKDLVEKVPQVAKVLEFGQAGAYDMVADAHYQAMDGKLPDKTEISMDAYARVLWLMAALRVLYGSDKKLQSEYDMGSILRYDKESGTFPELEEKIKKIREELGFDEQQFHEVVELLVAIDQIEKKEQRFPAKKKALEVMRSAIGELPRKT